MTDTKRLEEYIQASGYKKSYIAKTIGVSVETLSRKLRNATQFKASEIKILCALLNIQDPAEKEAIFFAGK